MNIYLPTKARCSRALLIAFSLLVVWFVVSSGSAYANTITIQDQSNVLNASKVRSEAAQLPASVLIYTTRTFTGDQVALDNDARSRLSGANIIDIAIDTAQRHLSIESGSQVKLSDEQASNAIDAFKSNFHNGDYTSATIAAIDAVHTALTGGSSSNSIASVGIAAVIIFAVFLFGIIPAIRNRLRGGPPMGGSRRWVDQRINNGSTGGGAGGSF